MKSKRLIYLMSTALSLSVMLAYSPALQASFTREELQALNDVNHRNVKSIVERQFRENGDLLNSSRNQDIVVFLGRTGAGKSTLINYLSNKDLMVDNNGIDIKLRNTADTQAMRIGSAGLASETLLPKFIRANNLLLYDLPGFGDTRGAAISLINAYFIKTLIQNARTARLVFVTSSAELEAGRGLIFRELIDITRRLIPNQTIEGCSALIITKTNASQDKQQVIDRYQSRTQTDETNPTSSLLTPWISGQTVTKMSTPSNNTINQNDKTDILNVISRTTARRLDNVNIAVIYNGEERNKLREIYQAEITEVSDKEYNDNFNSQPLSSLNSQNLQTKKAYFQNNFLNSVVTKLDQSPLILLLKPLSVDIYNTTWNEKRETLQTRSQQAVSTIEAEIQRQARVLADQQAAEEARRAAQAEAARRAEEQRRIQAELNDPKNWPSSVETINETSTYWGQSFLGNRESYTGGSGLSKRTKHRWPWCEKQINVTVQKQRTVAKKPNTSTFVTLQDWHETSRSEQQTGAVRATGQYAY